MKAHERLLKYVSYRTPSDENSDTSPSSRCQFELAHELVNELKALGVADAECDEYCYVYGHIPATPGKENATAIGFCAHMDTVKMCIRDRLYGARRQACVRHDILRSVWPRVI